MSFTTRSLSILALSLGLMGAAYAQDTTTPSTTTTPDAATHKHGGKLGDKQGRKFDRAMDGKFGKFGAGPKRFGGFGPGVTLTDDQKAQIQKIREANRPDPANFKELR